MQVRAPQPSAAADFDDEHDEVATVVFLILKAAAGPFSHRPIVLHFSGREVMLAAHIHVHDTTGRLGSCGSDSNGGCQIVVVVEVNVAGCAL